MASKVSYIGIVVVVGENPAEQLASVASQEFDYDGAAQRWAAQTARQEPEDSIAYVVRVADGWAAQTAWAYVGRKWRDAIGPDRSHLPAFVECMTRHGVGVHIDGVGAEDHVPGNQTPLASALKCGDIGAAVCTAALADARAKGIDLQSADPPAGEPVATVQVFEKLPGVALVDSTPDGLTSDLGRMGFGRYPKQYGGRGVVVAVLDTGCRRNVPELGDRIVGYIDATGQDGRAGDGSGHGTFVASQIVGVLADGTQIGGAPGASLLIVKVLTNAGWGTDTMIARGVYAAIAAKAHAITMSLGGSGPMPQTEKALMEARRRGVIITAACGNDGPGSGVIAFPARYPACVSIGSCDDTLTRSPFSQTSGDTDLYTLGSAQLGVAPGGRLERWSGTSMATPHAAAAAALYVEQVNTQGGTKPGHEVIIGAMTETDTPPGSIRGVNPGDDAGFVAVDRGHAKLAESAPPPPPPPPPADPDYAVFRVKAGSDAAAAGAEMLAVMTDVYALLAAGHDAVITVGDDLPPATPGGKHDPAPADGCTVPSGLRVYKPTQSDNGLAA